MISLRPDWKRVETILCGDDGHDGCGIAQYS